MQVHHLRSVDGEIVFDMDPEVVSPAAGGTRMVGDVTVDELALLARAMTYKLAVFEGRIGGAKAGIRPRLLDSRAQTLERYCDEVRPLVQAGTFLTGADLGTTTADVASLGDGTPSVFDEVVDGVGFEELVTGRGVVAAAEAWLGTLEGRTVALEGFGKVGHGVAREVVRRGARLVAVSTLRGAVARASGFDVDELVQARAEHGESFVHHLGLDVHLPRELHELRVDVLVPGARVGVYDAELAGRVQAQVVAPAANVPYTVGGLAVLRANRVAALPDFVCNGGAVLAYQSSRALTAAEVLRRVDREIGERIDAARLAKMDPIRHAAMLAETFLATWVPADQRPDGPAVAP
ncbi:MAG: Glu/Leu/Phe/Val dehydrogenase dimerization domain-containing protein [Acidimicrobiia bacterium]